MTFLFIRPKIRWLLEFGSSQFSALIMFHFIVFFFLNYLFICDKYIQFILKGPLINLSLTVEMSKFLNIVCMYSSILLKNMFIIFVDTSILFLAISNYIYFINYNTFILQLTSSLYEFTFLTPLHLNIYF